MEREASRSMGTWLQLLCMIVAIAWMDCLYCDTTGFIKFVIQACIVFMTALTHCLNDQFIATVACCCCYMTCVVLSMYQCMRALTCGCPLAPLFDEEPTLIRKHRRPCYISRTLPCEKLQAMGLIILQARFASRRRIKLVWDKHT